MASTTVGGVTVTMQGAAQLRRTLKQAGADLQDMSDLHAEVGRVVVGEAHAWSPKRSGALDASIRAGRLRTGAIVRAGSGRVPYAGVQEWGWPGHNIRPQPYLTTAAKATEPTWTDVYAAGVDRIISKVRGV